jgi:hypothetical protein
MALVALDQLEQLLDGPRHHAWDTEGAFVWLTQYGNKHTAMRTRTRTQGSAYQAGRGCRASCASFLQAAEARSGIANSLVIGEALHGMAGGHLII